MRWEPGLEKFVWLYWKRKFSPPHFAATLSRADINFYKSLLGEIAQRRKYFICFFCYSFWGVSLNTNKKFPTSTYP
jgi:hypothetical protein